MVNLDKMSKKELKTFIQAYNSYVQDFDYSEPENAPVSINEFYDYEYQEYLNNDENVKDIKSQKDDLYIVYSTDLLQNSSSKEVLAYCTNLEFAKDTIAKTEHNSDCKYIISKAELNSEIVNEAILAIYDGVDGLEWKSSNYDGKYNEFPKKEKDNVEKAYDLLKTTVELSADVLTGELDYKNSALSVEKQQVLKKHIDSLTEEFGEMFDQKEFVQTDTKIK